MPLRWNRSSCLLLAGWLNAACGGSRSPSIASRQTTSSVASIGSTKVAPASSAEAKSEALPTIGFSALPQPITANASKLHAAAKKRLDAADYAAAAEGFEKALAASPDFLLAEYDLACAQARLGNHAAAMPRLLRVLEADLVTFLVPVETDAHLADLRASPSFAAVHARLLALEKAWQSARTTGLPTVLLRPTPKPASQGYVSPPVLLRIGTYLPDPERFVPLTRSITGAMGAYADGPRGGLTVSAVAGRGLMGTYLAPATVLAQAFALRDTEPFAHFSYPTGGSSVFLSLDDGTPTALRVGVSAYENGFTPVWRRVEGNKSTLSTRPTTTPVLEVRGEGSQLFVPSAPGYVVNQKTAKLTLPDARAVQLSQGHLWARPTVLLAPDGKSAVVVGVVNECICTTGISLVQRHIVSRIDLASATATTMSEGKGLAEAAFAPDGSLYLQVDATLQRFASGASTSPTVVMTGVLLTPPFGEMDCCGA